MKVEQWEISEVKPYENITRINAAAVDAITLAQTTDRSSETRPVPSHILHFSTRTRPTYWPLPSHSGHFVTAVRSMRRRSSVDSCLSNSSANGPGKRSLLSESQRRTALVMVVPPQACCGSLSNQADQSRPAEPRSTIILNGMFPGKSVILPV
jgi:hypothetical protein